MSSFSWNTMYTILSIKLLICIETTELNSQYFFYLNKNFLFSKHNITKDVLQATLTMCNSLALFTLYQNQVS